MREMKDSGVDWIGKIPKSWYLTKIKYCVDLCGSGTTPKSNNIEYYDGDVSWIQSGDLYSTDVIKDTAVKITGIALRDHSALKVYKKDFLVLAMYGASIGNVSISKIDACVNQACCCLKTNANNDLMFLYYWLLYCKENFLIKAVGGTQPNISQVMIKNQCFLVVPYREQLKIVSYLDRECEKLNKITADIEREIEVLQEYKQSVITKAVTKGLDKNVAMKDSGIDWIGYIPQHWKKIKLKYLVSIRSGDAFAVSELLDDGIYPVYGGGEQIGMCDKFNANEKDILIGRVGARCGCVSYPQRKVYATDNALVVTSKYNTTYLSYILESMKLNRLNTSNAQPLITGAKIKNAYISFVFDEAEQKNIVEYLDEKCAEIELIIDDKQKQLYTLSEYKKSLIYEYVTGKKEVPVDA